MTAPLPVEQLAEALRLGKHELVSFVGGGGKTTALFALGNQLEGSVVLTTTTKMGRHRSGGRPVLFAPTDAKLADVLAAERVLLAWGADGDHKALGVAPETAERWLGLADHVVVEADGSRRMPFKAPRPYEPVIPAGSTMVVACVGAAALGRVIADQCQRPMRVAAVAGCSPYERLTPARLARVLLSERGSRKHCPPEARFAVLVNQVTDDHAEYLAELIDEIDGTAPLVPVAVFEPGESPEEHPR